MGTTVTDVTTESKSPKQSISPTRQGKPSSPLPLCGSLHRHTSFFFFPSHCSYIVVIVPFVFRPALRATSSSSLPEKLNCPIARPAVVAAVDLHKSSLPSQVPSAQRSTLSPSRTHQPMVRRPSRLHRRPDQDNHNKAPTPRNTSRLRSPEAPSAWSPIRLSSRLGVVVQRLPGEPSSPASPP